MAYGYTLETSTSLWQSRNNSQRAEPRAWRTTDGESPPRADLELKQKSFPSPRAQQAYHSWLSELLQTMESTSNTFPPWMAVSKGVKSQKHCTLAVQKAGNFPFNFPGLHIRKRNFRGHPFWPDMIARSLSLILWLDALSEYLRRSWICKSLSHCIWEKRG